MTRTRSKELTVALRMEGRSSAKIHIIMGGEHGGVKEKEETVYEPLRNGHATL